MRNAIWLVSAGIAIGLAAFWGFHLGASEREAGRAQAQDTARQFAESGVASAQQGDLEMADLLLRRAIKGMGASPTECRFVWRAIELLPPATRSDPALAGIAGDFSAGLDQAMLSCATVEHFSELFKLRSVVKKTAQKGAVVPSAGSQIASQVNPVGAFSVADDVDPESLFDEGISAWRKKDLDRADFLTQAALRALARKPSSARAIWEKFRVYLKEGKLEPREETTRLLIYRQSVETALLSCNSVHDFVEVWAVRERVLAAINDARARLVSDLTIRIADYQKRVREMEVVAALDEFGTLRAAIDPQMTILIATRPAEQSGSIKQGETVAFVQCVVDFSSRLSAQIDRLEEQAKQQNEEAESGGAIEAVEQGSGGLCEKLLGEIQALDGAMRQAQLDRWLAPGRDDGEQHKLSSLGQRLAKLYAKVSKLQQLRYNLWAVQRISAAESVDHWDAYLGGIDTGLLHPSVSALYSSVYDSRIKQVEDPQSRATTVQHILAGQKTALTAL